VLLDAAELWQTAELGLIMPLTADEAAMLNQLYPFAVQGVTYGGQIWGVPYVADLIHAAYQRAAIDEALLTWADLLESNHTYLFPAGSRDGYANASVLLQYVGAGGQLLEDGTVSNPDALEAVFEFYLSGMEQGHIPSEIEQYAGLNSVWRAFEEGLADMVDTSSTLLLNESDPAAEMGYASVPTLTGDSTTLANTWAFSIVSTDPDQRQLALDLVATLLDPTVQGAWSQFVHRLPTQPAALDQWASGSEYHLFLRDQMVPVAISVPNGRLFEQFTVRLQDALRGVLTGSLTPADAVLEVRAGP
jgi:ABC-type glycerol-3-phosphate transport system substrate-binding protein